MCPNGHKLNVKAFLAGKRGICPDCDAKFIVPQLSGALAVPVEPEVVPTSVEPPSTIAPAPQITELPSTPKLLPSAPKLSTSKLRKPGSSSRRERAWRVSVALGTLVLLLAVALGLVLWYQN